MPLLCQQKHQKNDNKNAYRSHFWIIDEAASPVHVLVSHSMFPLLMSKIQKYLNFSFWKSNSFPTHF